MAEKVWKGNGGERPRDVAVEENQIDIMSTGEKKPEPLKAKTCGLVMPIAMCDGCPPGHWEEVMSILKEAVSGITDPKFEVNLVSASDVSGVILKRIVQNLHNADMVVCDVSGKNPNVMFELGMRLTFDKPTIIVKDDKTDFSFDTGIIEHLIYPRDLRFARINEFKAILAAKVAATHKAAAADSKHSPFLRHFGTFKAAQLEEREGTAIQGIVEKIDELASEVRQLRGAEQGGKRLKDYAFPEYIEEALHEFPNDLWHASRKVVNYWVTNFFRGRGWKIELGDLDEVIDEAMSRLAKQSRRKWSWPEP